METNKEFLKKVELYVGQIVNKSLDDVRSFAFGTHQRELIGRNVIKADTSVSSNASLNGTSVKQFAEGLEDGCFKDGMQEISKQCKMKPILCLGIVALDLVTICEEFPLEDTKTVAVGHYWSRGGNAANTATVLAHLGAPVEYFGTFVKNRWTEFLENDFKLNGVCIKHCIYLDQDKHTAPIATFLLSQKTGSRTAIADFKGITGPTYENFSALNLADYCCIHIESRSFKDRPKEIREIIDLIKTYNETSEADEKVVISVEIKQSHSTDHELFTLFDKADIVLIGKDFATHHGYTCKEDAVRELYKHCKTGAILVCTWGSEGAAAMYGDQLMYSPSFPPKELVDTIGAGDTFNAGLIYAINKGKSIAKAVEFGCMVAGHKCGHRGFACVKCVTKKL